jgi:hypothetical protein
MINRIYRSLSARTSIRYRETLRGHFRRAVIREGYWALPAKRAGKMALLLYAGKEQSEMVRECVWWVYHAWGELPAIRLVSDGTMSERDLLDLISWWPGEKAAESWEASAESHAARGRTDLRLFAQKNVLGKKLSAILASGEREPTLYCDTDVLWFSGPPPLPEAKSGTPVVQLAVDVVRHYDDRLLGEVGIRELDAPPALNTGVVFASGEIYEACGLDRIMSAAAREPSYFSEQTIMAYCCRRLGNAHWTQEKIALNLDDMYWPVRGGDPRRGWCARHYVGDVRHWFWRDALWLRRYVYAARGGEAESRANA